MFNAVQLAARAGTFETHFRGHIQIERQVGAKITQYGITQRGKHCLVDAASSALIRLSRQIVTVADHPLALGQRGFDHRLNQLNARRVEHQHFGFVSDNFVADGFDIQYQAAQLFSQLRAARLAGKYHVRHAKRFERIHHHVAGGGFTRPFESLNDNVFTAHFFP